MRGEGDLDRRRDAGRASGKRQDPQGEMQHGGGTAGSRDAREAATADAGEAGGRGNKGDSGNGRGTNG